MKINSTVVLTLILLTLMLGAGSVSAFLGFTMGSSALKGVTTPDGRPATKFASGKTNNAQQVGISLLKEDEILKSVQSRIQGNTSASKAKKLDEDEDETKTKKPEVQETPQEVTEEKLQPGFPVVAESEGVTLSVQSARYSGGDLLLKVKMQNQGADSVRFLYSFLDVTDDKGRTLSAITEGLPAELPTKGPTFTGTISIPTALLDDVSKISLALTDYPAQKLKLQVSDIPVEK
ncbi:hypothetical protein H6G54_13465 [Anabaena cylindrica FACHB-243]|uniref:Uncharacterized protein n=1 Tax=Anabaena cylindrica (strain ATCC 27899 / PCC 7122) TaxID=272123 RepID=K9ZM76_ANACC|nr:MULTISPECIES: hypothetical protein [Anabaena]AFZ59652.1 hypothetical protein Anacy_4288 [Anabaena cylindrica PCC 7122]MBD2418686.1 hypothetical protein [Anabaena cylindrica FACHB-243]MBY5281685.1 hypothetical protein [Anabaena sp. CCAP 1446/1C]MBY5309211.1 hypothetical protein [Anabaena sp. CCAP 1446/1C]MCM2406248.1 hypothetical protein [Anabaena sp. CCAP 1446/1C]